MIPSYKRIENLKTIIDSVYNTVNDLTNICFTFCINKKDRESIDFLNEYFTNKNIYDIILEETRQPNLSKYFNMMYDRTKFKDAIVTELGDDMIFRTKDWDIKIIDEINKYNGLRIVYCDDDFTAHDKCCVNMFTTREMVTATKNPFMCEFFHADMIDVVWYMVGLITGTLSYFENIKIFHNHNTRKEKDEWDETFQRLVPVQNAARSKENQHLAICYSTLVARNLIEGGIGSWNVLQ